jgi:hypothetical protein
MRTTIAVALALCCASARAEERKATDILGELLSMYQVLENQTIILNAVLQQQGQLQIDVSRLTDRCGSREPPRALWLPAEPERH